MAHIAANLNDIEAWGGESTQLPPGPYQLQIKKADTEARKKEDGSETLQLVVEYEVLSGAFAGKPARAYFSLDFTKDVPRKRLKSLVQATGIQLASDGGFDSSQLVGSKLNADAIVQTYDAKPDPLTGISAQKESVRIVNERPFGPLGDTNNASTVSPDGRTIGGRSLPGLTKA